MFRTSFCAVPAFSRVEPASSSAPTGTQTSCVGERRRARTRGRRRRSRSALAQLVPPRARRRTNGERPLALIPTTASAVETPSAVDRAGAGRRRRPRPLPARSSDGKRDAARLRTSGSHSAASSAARRPDVPAPDVDQAPAGCEPCGDVVDQGRDLRRGAGDGSGDRGVRRVHQLDELARGAEVEICACRVPRFGAELVEGGHRSSQCMTDRAQVVKTTSRNMPRRPRRWVRRVVLTTSVGCQSRWATR